MGKNYKTKRDGKKVLMPFILVIVFILIVLIGGKSCVNAEDIVEPINAFYDVQIVSTQYFDDFPTSESGVTNGWSLDKKSFGYISYDDKKVWFEILYNSSSTQHTQSVLYLSNNYLSNTELVWEDGEYGFVLQSDLGVYIDVLLKQLHNDTLIRYYSNQASVFINMGGFDSIGYYYGGNQSVMLVNYEVSENWEYKSYFGTMNSLWFNNEFYNYINHYYEDILMYNDVDGARRMAKAYYENEVIPQIRDYYSSLFDDYYQDGVEYGMAHGTEELSLRGLISDISLFPVLFFTEGLDVEIFGVNIGALILGIFMIGLTLVIIKGVIGILR